MMICYWIFSTCLFNDIIQSPLFYLLALMYLSIQLVQLGLIMLFMFILFIKRDNNYTIDMQE